MTNDVLKQFLVNLSNRVKSLEERNILLEERLKSLDRRMGDLEVSVQATLPAATPPPPLPVVAPPPLPLPVVAPPPPPPEPVLAPPPMEEESPPDLKSLAQNLIHPSLRAAPKVDPTAILKEMLEATGKLNYQSLKQLAREKSESEFLQILRHPVLMGAALFKGMVVDDAEEEDLQATVMFRALPSQSKGAENKVKMDVLEKSIYPLLKRHPAMPGSHGANTVVFSVGRLEENDIVMLDPTISKKQAEIRVTREGKGTLSFFLRDLGSTNEVRVNGSRLTSFEVVEIKTGDEVKFGRFFFLFASPRTVREKLLED